MVSQIILNLDEDGIEMRSLKKSLAEPDIDGDVADQVSRARDRDGLLVLDRNGTGKIIHASELPLGTGSKRCA